MLGLTIVECIDVNRVVKRAWIFKLQAGDAPLLWPRNRSKKLNDSVSGEVSCFERGVGNFKPVTVEGSSFNGCLLVRQKASLICVPMDDTTIPFQQ